MLALDALRRIVHCGPPVALFKSLAKQFPTHEIVIHSDEYGNHFHRSFTLMGGQIACADVQRLVPLLRGEHRGFVCSEPDGLEIEEAPATTGQQQSAMSRSWSF